MLNNIAGRSAAKYCAFLKVIHISNDQIQYLILSTPFRSKMIPVPLSPVTTGITAYMGVSKREKGGSMREVGVSKWEKGG